jgi:hypothetical protein
MTTTQAALLVNAASILLRHLLFSVNYFFRSCCLRKKCYRSGSCRFNYWEPQRFVLSSAGRVVEPRESGKPAFGFPLFLGPSELLECGNGNAISKGGGKGGKPGFGFPGFPRTAISTAFARLRWSNRDYGVACWPRKSTGDFSVGGRVQSGSSDEEALHHKTGTVLSVHLLLHEDSRICSGRIRHAKVFQGIAALRAPNGAHAGS